MGAEELRAGFARRQTSPAQLWNGWPAECTKPRRRNSFRCRSWKPRWRRTRSAATSSAKSNAYITLKDRKKARQTASGSVLAGRWPTPTCIPGLSELGFRTQGRRESMTSMRNLIFAVLLFFLMLPLACSQVEKITFAAGTPEDKDLNLISSQSDPQKQIAMYQDFLQKYAANPLAVTYANWQLSQVYLGTGDLQKATEY